MYTVSYQMSWTQMVHEHNQTQRFRSTVWQDALQEKIFNTLLSYLECGILVAGLCFDFLNAHPN